MQNGLTSVSEPAGDRLLIVDGHAYAYRAFYALTTLTSPTGQPTNAIYGFIRMLGKMRERVQSTRMVVVWDGGLAAERMALLPGYKAQRPEMPGSLASQLDEMVLYLRAVGIYSLMKEGCEADDLIAVLAVRAAADQLPVVIASSDKDFMQLVSPLVRLLVPHDKTESLWDEAPVRQKTGVEPGQIVDWLSLVGDAVDNIPGVPGVGLKIAADLLRQFGTLDVLYARLAEVRSERLRARLEAEEGTVRKNRQLIKLNDTMACALSWDELAVKKSDLEALRRLYTVWGFKNMLKALEEEHAPRAEDLFHEHAQAV